jgi:hypothetical protein
MGDTANVSKLPKAQKVQKDNKCKKSNRSSSSSQLVDLLSSSDEESTKSNGNNTTKKRKILEKMSCNSNMNYNKGMKRKMIGNVLESSGVKVRATDNATVKGSVRAVGRARATVRATGGDQDDWNVESEELDLESDSNRALEQDPNPNPNPNPSPNHQGPTGVNFSEEDNRLLNEQVRVAVKGIGLVSFFSLTNYYCNPNSNPNPNSGNKKRSKY